MTSTAPAHPTPRLSDYLECTICARRSLHLQVDIATGVCVRCKVVATAQHVASLATDLLGRP